jgi:hypothetical protein
MQSTQLSLAQMGESFVQNGGGQTFQAPAKYVSGFKVLQIDSTLGILEPGDL